MAEWAVEVLNDVVGAELLSLPKDMQARFLRISELLESFGPQRVGLPHVGPLGEELWEMRLSGSEGTGRAICTADSGTAVDRLACVCEEDAEDPARRTELGA